MVIMQIKESSDLTSLDFFFADVWNHLVNNSRLSFIENLKESGSKLCQKNYRDTKQYSEEFTRQE